MGDHWLTKEGSRGDLTIKKKDGNWYTTGIEETVQCILKSDDEVPSSDVVCTVDATVDKYMYSSGPDPDTAILNIHGDISTIGCLDDSADNIQKELAELEESSNTENVYYDPSVLREWQNGNRFYANNCEKRSYSSGEPYFGCKSTSKLWQNNFSSDSVRIESGDTGTRKYSIGKVNDKIVIISLGPERFWEP